MAQYLQGRWKLGLYFCASLTVAGIRMASLYENSPNFYIMGLKSSQNESMLIFGNLIVASMLFFGTWIQYLIFGELRLIEIEHLYERSWATVIGLVMSGSLYSGNDTNSIFLIFLSCGLLFTKAFHSIISDRSEWLIQQHYQRTDSTLKKLLINRVTILHCFIIYFDGYIIKSCIDESFTTKSSMLLVIAFEFFLLMIDTIYCGIKFSLDVFEIFHILRYPEDEIWSYKIWVDSIARLILNLSKSVMIPTLFIFFTMLNTIPFNLLSEIFRSFYTLSTSVKSLLQLVRNARRMNELMQKPTREEVETTEICIICRDDLVFEGTGNTRSVPAKLSCGHVLHDGCIRSWLEMSNACPTCRKVVIPNTEINQIEAAPVPEPQPAVALAREEEENVRVDEGVNFDNNIPGEERDTVDYDAFGDSSYRVDNDIQWDNSRYSSDNDVNDTGRDEYFTQNAHSEVHYDDNEAHRINRLRNESKERFTEMRRFVMRDIAKLIYEPSLKTELNTILNVAHDSSVDSDQDIERPHILHMAPDAEVPPGWSALPMRECNGILYIDTGDRECRLRVLQRYNRGHE